jgi:hypothetical protein
MKKNKNYIKKKGFKNIDTDSQKSWKSVKEILDNIIEDLTKAETSYPLHDVAFITLCILHRYSPFLQKHFIALLYHCGVLNRAQVLYIFSKLKLLEK